MTNAISTLSPEQLSDITGGGPRMRRLGRQLSNGADQALTGALAGAGLGVATGTFIGLGAGPVGAGVGALVGAGAGALIGGGIAFSNGVVNAR